MKKLKVLDLFSGSGMFSHGLEETGLFTTAAFCENDDNCRKILLKNFKGTKIFGDIRELTALDIPIKLDVVTASWPCQGHSVAGKKRGLNDERSGLWKEVKRVLRETQPTWFIGENSANLRTNGLTEVLQDLWEVGFHNIRWDVLPAEAYGAIHKRERIFILANSNGYGLDEVSYAPTKEEQEWRAKTWVDFCNRECPEPEFHRVVNEDTSIVDKPRRIRVKMCGNSLYWPIVNKIGMEILKHEQIHN